MFIRCTKNSHVFFTAIIVAVQLGGSILAAEPGNWVLPSKTIPTGIYELDETLVIPRQRPMPHQRDKTANGVPAPYLAKQSSWPGGLLRGEDWVGTVLRFSPNIKGCFIKTEGFGEGHVGAAWNHNNTQGDTNLRSNLCSSARDLSIDGQAELRPYPYAYFDWHPKPDPHGPDMKPRANGLCIEGSGFRAERLRFFQIPGTAIVAKGGKGDQSGAFGIYDGGQTELRDISVFSAINGIEMKTGDAKLSHIYVTAVAKDGLIMQSAGAILDSDHICGADRAAVFLSPAMASNCYHESARIGTHILAGAEGTRIDGLYIGPATCRERAVKIEASGVSVLGLWGAIPAETDKHPDVVGVEIVPGPFNVTVEGSITVDGDKSGNSTAKGLVLSGHGHKIDLRGGWNVPTKAVFVRVAGSTTGTAISIRGHGEGGAALDLSASKLDQVNGLGNEFKVSWSGKATRVIYPGGGSRYNLAPGTQLWIDGVLQTAEPAKKAL